jgi:serine O-acetyltransferase
MTTSNPLPGGLDDSARGEPPGPAAELTRVVDALCAGSRRISAGVRRNPCNVPLPSRDAVAKIVSALRSVLFPGYFGNPDLRHDSLRFHVGATLDALMGTVREQVHRGLCFVCEREAPDAAGCCDDRADDICQTFLGRLPEIQETLRTDVLAAYQGDPAARSPDETIFCYPGVLAIISHRIAHELYQLGVPLLPRIINEQAHSVTGIDIHPGATIGPSFFIDHGTGVVIGETSVIGTGVRLYQGVTLGAKSFPLDADGRPVKGIARHPIVEDDVTIYAGATILGRIRIGKGSVIGGNVWVVRSVPPGSKVLQTPGNGDPANGNGNGNG